MHLNRTSILNLSLWGAGILLWLVFDAPLALLLPIAVMLVREAVYYAFGVNLFYDLFDLTSNAYAFFSDFVPKPYGQGLDLGFNIYVDDVQRSPRDAQRKKFELAAERLGIREGSRVLDIGCGFGDWLTWLKEERGCSVTGMNLNPEQVGVCRERGLDVHLRNWMDLRAEPEGDLARSLRGSFDVVTLWDTVEHYAKSVDRHRPEAQAQVYRDLFSVLDELLDPAGPQRHVWISCLHRMRPLEGVYEHWHGYLMNSFYSGLLPQGEKGLSAVAAERDLTLEWSADHTADYVLTSLLNREHFGRYYIEWTPRRLAKAVAWCFIDPLGIQKWLYHINDTWLWQFGFIPFEPDPIARLFFQVYRKPAEG